jgi:hypothetical protein
MELLYKFHIDEYAIIPKIFLKSYFPSKNFAIKNDAERIAKLLKRI